MFGYVLVNKPELKIKEFEKYRSYYCGLCHALGERHGQTARLTLNYDMTFLIMLLSDLYDEEETVEEGRCIVHPVQKHTSRRTAATDYCADMCLLLAYYKCQDDWNDEKKVSARASMAALKGRAEKIAAQYPQKADLIAKKMNMLTIVESAKDLPMDKVAKVFGEIMAEVFVYKDDVWKEDLYRLGFFLGKYIYLLDAIRRIEGVKNAKQYTIPVEEALEAVRSGNNPELTTRQKHIRECFVVAEEGADLAKIEETIKTMPNYFADYDTFVHFISEEELARDHSGIPHGGFVLRSGVTGWNRENKHLIEYSLKLDSNPEFTASVIVAYARAAYRMNQEGMTGCKTVFDVAPAYLSPLSGAELRKNLL